MFTKNIKLRFYGILFHKLSGTGIGRYKLVDMINKKIRSNIKPEYVEMYGYRVYLDPNDHFGLSVKSYPIPKIYKKFIHPGDIVVDVGSNIGIHTLYLSKLVGNHGQVYSFEPEPKNFLLLKKNIEFNKCNNVVIEQKAISDKTGKIKLVLSDSMAGHRLTTSSSNENVIEVDCMTLDDYFKNHESRINFIKIDAEGFDGNVIHGSLTILSKSNHLNLFTEFHSKLLKNSDIGPEKLFELIEQNNFKIYEVNNDELTFTNFLQISKKYNDEKYYLTDLFCTRLDNISTHL